MFKYLVLFSVIFCNFLAFADTSDLCPNEDGYYFVNYRERNPQKGGFVSNQAYVDDTTDSVFIGPDAAICASSNISKAARIYGNAVIRGAQVSDNAQVYENAVIENSAIVRGKARIYGDALISGSAIVEGDAVVAGNAQVINVSEDDLVQISENARITGEAKVTNNAQVKGSARVQGKAIVSGDAIVKGNTLVSGCSKITTGEVSSGVFNEQGQCDRVLTGSNFPESRHPYTNSLQDTQVYKLSNYPALDVNFDENTATEEGRDFLSINGTKYSGTSLAGQKVRVFGDTVTILLVSDHSNTLWGYRVSDVKGVTQEQLDLEAQQEQERLRREQERQQFLNDRSTFAQFVNNTVVKKRGRNSASDNMYRYSYVFQFTGDCTFNIQSLEQIFKYGTSTLCYDKTEEFNSMNLTTTTVQNQDSAIRLYFGAVRAILSGNGYSNSYCSFGSSPRQTVNRDDISIRFDELQMQQVIPVVNRLVNYCKSH